MRDENISAALYIGSNRHNIQSEIEHIKIWEKKEGEMVNWFGESISWRKYKKKMQPNDFSMNIHQTSKW